MHMKHLIFFSFMTDIARDSSSDEEVIAKNQIYPDLLPFNLPSTGDMVGHNKCMKRVDVHFPHNIFFMCCDEVRSNSYAPKPNLYSSICDEFHSEIEGWKCYHQRLFYECNQQNLRHVAMSLST